MTQTSSYTATPLSSFRVDGKSKLLVFNVKEYGANGDGTTDDTTAIQNALNAAATAGGGIVFIPQSTYVVSNLTIDSYVQLCGSGWGTILLAKSGATGYMVALKTATTTKQTAIRNITIKPNQSGLGGIQLDNTLFSGSDDPRHILEDVTVTNSQGDAFNFVLQRELFVTRCRAINGQAYGFNIGTACTDSRFTDCTAGVNANHGFYINGNNNSFVGCKAFWSGYNGTTWGTTQSGFYLNSVSYVHMASCEAQQNALHGFSLISCSRVVVVSCDSDTNSAGTTGGAGFNTYWCTNSSISACTGTNNGAISPGNQAYGLQVDGTQTNLCFVFNTVTGSSGNFGYVSGSGYILLDPTVIDFSGIPVKANDFTLFGLADGTNATLGTSTGSEIGTATTQKLAFYGATPIVQPGNTTDLGTVLSNLGLRASGSAYPITTSGTVALTGAVTSNNMTFNNNAVTVTSNAGTCSASFRLNTFTNSSAATMAITLSTSGAVDGQAMIVRVYDFSAVTQTIGWTNTENSTVSAPTTSNGSTTLPLTVGFMYNGSTSKWRCIAVS